MKANRRAIGDTIGVSHVLGVFLMMPVILMLISMMMLNMQGHIDELRSSQMDFEDLVKNIDDANFSINYSRTKSTNNIIWADNFEKPKLQWDPVKTAGSSVTPFNHSHYYTSGHSLRLRTGAINTDYSGINKPFSGQAYGMVSIEIAFTYTKGEAYKIFTITQDDDFNKASIRVNFLTKNLEYYDGTQYIVFTGPDNKINLYADEDCWHHMKLIIDYEPDSGGDPEYVGFILNGKNYENLQGLSLGKPSLYRPPKCTNISYINQRTTAGSSMDSYVDDFVFRNLTEFIANTGSVTLSPIANFEYNPNNPTTASNIIFTDTSSGVITKWNWVFGDGDTSSEENPEHQYSSPGTYTVTLNVEDDKGETSSKDKILIVIDIGSSGIWPTLHNNERNTGFTNGVGSIVSPDLKWEFDYSGMVSDLPVTSPVLGDVDNDGVVEVIINDEEQGLIRCVNGVTGLEEWSQPFGGLQSTPALKDVDGDPELEIFVVCPGSLGGSCLSPNIRCLDGADGSEEWVYCVVQPNLAESSPVLDDVDGDGVPEVIASCGTMTYCLNAIDGNLKWQSVHWMTAGDSAAVLDIDNDGVKEVFLNHANHLEFWCLNGADGSEIWESGLNPDCHFTPAISDLNSDGSYEIVTCDCENVYCLNAEDGSLKWSYHDGVNPVSSPAIANVDSDNNLEVILSFYNRVVCLNGDTGGEKWARNTAPTLGYSPSIADIDNDGQVEIIVPSGASWTELEETIICLNGATGSEEWTYDISWPASITSPALGDIDGDGEIEIVACGMYRLYCIDGAVGNSPSASFTFNPEDPTDFDNIKFTDSSIDPDGFIKSWSWNFGDGSTSSVQNPEHQYASAGTYTVTLIVTDNDDLTDDYQREIIVDNAGFFTFRIQTTTPTETFSFQTDNAVNLYVDWGDGNEETFDGTDLRTHEYATVGVYDISLNGIASRISFYEGFTEDLLIDVLTKMSDGLTGINSARRMFRDTENFGVFALTEPAFFDGVSGNIINMEYMFYGSSFNQPINSWDVSKVTTMMYMFGFSSFNQPLNNWDVSHVTNMRSMFTHTPFNQDISSWDVSKVTDMSHMLSWSLFNQTLNTWDVSNVKNMDHMFSGPYVHTDKYFNQPLNNWDVSNVTNMRYMFYYSQFNQPINNWDVSNVTTMRHMFAYSEFNQPLNSWDVSKVTDMWAMFGHSPFNQDIISWDVSKVTLMPYMFSNTPFNQDISSWEVSKVTNMECMFTQTPFNYPLNSWDVSQVTDMRHMFNHSLYNWPLNNWDVSKVIDMRGMFSRSSFNQPIGNWNVMNVQYMDIMFEYSVFNQDISSWDVSNVINMEYMFYSSLFNQDISSWDVSKVTNMRGMFNFSALSSDNYNALLIGWNSLPSLQDDVEFGVKNLRYCSGGAARSNIISNHGWKFNGDILDC